MTKIKVLHDYQYEGWEAQGEAVAGGTIIEDAELVPTPWYIGVEVERGVDPGPSARYAHPITGSEWISYPGAYVVLED